jgi:hypothetical protein
MHEQRINEDKGAEGKGFEGRKRFLEQRGWCVESVLGRAGVESISYANPGEQANFIHL